MYALYFVTSMVGCQWYVRSEIPDKRVPVPLLALGFPFSVL